MIEAIAKAWPLDVAELMILTSISKTSAAQAPAMAAALTRGVVLSLITRASYRTLSHVGLKAGPILELIKT
ncbi:MAG: hypothetical protein CK529_05695 [Rhodospirillaceae bacterium]|nr:MAG: hypothetical protein CK529_05695 [Rhodospirillaceae bacterium]